ncbi:exonuclease [Kineococcus aurantiacus]|uniref:Exonuclease n=1 Tax=Kineococcus aurantiacus TaxID=37633 RepID=A0A7Y9DR53_9ACTN|nr:exonuclease [Kineococcus aurantiacus]NYD24946.1 hypothetical protein [Kineococcus aurantiacus]
MTAEAYFSTDVEADGPIPGPYSLSAIGVALCGYRTHAGDLVDVPADTDQPTFYAELRPISDTFDPEAAAVAGLDRNHLVNHGREPQQAMLAMNAFVDGTCARLTQQLGDRVRPVLACYPLGFDVMWVTWYAVHFTGRSPYGHSTHFDAKTAFATRAGRGIVGSTKRFMPAHLRSRRRHTHHALDDAREQGEMIMNIMRWDGT